ncbi:MAG: NAD(P)-dependent oxidoreductase [Acidimicrobiia bacterium]
MGSTSNDSRQGPIVVVGGGGFIGSALVKSLLEAGHGAITTYRERPNPALPKAIKQLHFSPENLVRTFRSAAAVVHLAARTGGIEFQRRQPFELFFSNRALTDQVLQAATATGVRKLLIASSAAVYAPSSVPLTEDAPTVDLARTESAYAAGKLLDELSAGWVGHTSHTIVITARIGNVYGEGGQFDTEQSSVVHGLIRRASDARHGGRLVAWGSPKTVRSFIHVQDVAAALALLVSSDVPSQTYNVDSGLAVTIGTLAALIAEQAAPGSTVSFDESRPRGDPYRVLSISRLENLGFKPAIDLEEGINRTLIAYLDRPAV